MTRRMITAEELAGILGEYDDEGKPRIESIRDKASSKAWPSRLVNGKLRFLYPDDVDQIFEICKRGPEDGPKPEVAAGRRSRTPKPTSNAQSTRPPGLTGFRDVPLSLRRGSA